MIDKSFIFLICARSGSKGIKNKNLKKILNVPLVGWSINIAKKISTNNKIIVSTDSTAIQRISKKYGAETPFLRPKKLSTSKASEFLVWRHALIEIEKKYKFMPKFIVSLPPTNPLRCKNDIKKAINLFKKNTFDAVISITKSNRSPFFNMVKKKGKLVSLISKNKKKFIRRQDVPTSYDICTAFYIVKSDFILKKNYLFDGKIAGYNLKKIYSIDIDDQIDFFLAKQLINNFNEK